jgi:hypothetical protein
VRLSLKGFVKGEERPGGLQAVSGHLQLCHGVNILNLKTKRIKVLYKMKIYQ